MPFKEIIVYYENLIKPIIIICRENVVVYYSCAYNFSKHEI
jgi:hypothetical protein